MEESLTQGGVERAGDGGGRLDDPWLPWEDTRPTGMGVWGQVKSDEFAFALLGKLLAISPTS